MQNGFSNSPITKGSHMIEKYDCFYAGLCPLTGRHCVREQLYPESRGWRERLFGTKEDALAWMAALPLPGDDRGGLD